MAARPQDAIAELTKFLYVEKLPGCIRVAGLFTFCYPMGYPKRCLRPATTVDFWLSI
jgi:hypothetical protein